MEAVKVLIAVKPLALARVIQHVLHGEAGISRIDFADSEQQLTAKAKRLRPALIILNCGLFHGDADEGLTRLKQANSESKLILTCDFEEFRRSIHSDIVDERLLDESLVQQLPAAARRLTQRPRANPSIAQKSTSA